MATIRGTASPGAKLRLFGLDGTAVTNAAVGATGKFEFHDLAPDWYLILADTGASNGSVKATHATGDVDVGFLPLPMLVGSRAAARVVTVCEAFGNRLALSGKLVVIVGIFKSGMDETLRLDCPFQLVSGDVGWPSAIGLTNPLPPPEALRAEIEKKRQEVIKSSPPEAPLRPERVVGLYGKFVSLAGLKTESCCKAPVETVLPPARLFGLSEIDRRVIR